MEKKIQVALIQFSPLSYDVSNNINKALFLSKQALEKGAKIIVLPELFNSGYCIEDKDKKYAFSLENLNHPILKILHDLAIKYKAYIIACSIEKDKNKLFDTAYIIGAKGLVGKYRKIYLWGKENKRFSKGKKYPIFKLKFQNFNIKIGLQICYEVGFSEGARILALQGAQIICYNAAFGKARSYAWDLASRARALENGIFILACNRSGKEISKIDKSLLEFAGNSRIINPKGEILAACEKEEGFIIREIDIDEVKFQRKTIPYLKDLNLKLTQKKLNEIYLNIKEKKWQKKF
ncbi:carbon-nitrogen hydrolase family protein [Campylobacter lari]|nr:carbon-nitrogen hydrolase family protein [Campylobacter lari]EAK3364952.1 carbon-nitrogen hydrolase family protein [Campylobacter lari]